MAASNHRLELEAYYLIILVAIRMRRKRKKELQRRGKEKEEVLGSKNIPETEFFTLLSRWDRQDRSMWFLYDFSDRDDRWNRGLPIAGITMIEFWHQDRRTDFSAILAISVII